MNSGGRRKEANKAGGCKNLSELIGMKQKHPTFHWSFGLKRKQTAGRDMWLEEQSLIERSNVSSSKTRSKEKPRQTYSSSNNKHVSYIQM